MVSFYSLALSNLVIYSHIFQRLPVFSLQGGILSTLPANAKRNCKHLSTSNLSNRPNITINSPA